MKDLVLDPGVAILIAVAIFGLGVLIGRLAEFWSPFSSAYVSLTDQRILRAFEEAAAAATPRVQEPGQKAEPTAEPAPHSDKSAPPPALPEDRIAFPLVRIVWHDSRQTTSEWQWEKGRKRPTAALVTTVGYLTDETPEAVSIASSVADGHLAEDDVQVMGVAQIPVASILRRGSVSEIKTTVDRSWGPMLAKPMHVDVNAPRPDQKARDQYRSDRDTPNVTDAELRWRVAVSLRAGQLRKARDPETAFVITAAEAINWKLAPEELTRWLGDQYRVTTLGGTPEPGYVVTLKPGVVLR